MHKSVLLEEAIQALNIKKNGVYVDCTLGYAGHASKILEKLGKEGFLFAFDQDEDAVKFSEEKLNKIGGNYKIFDTNFKNIKKNIDVKVDGILFDLGVSSVELDETDRGFSYHNDARLDMRMDRRQKLSAYEVVNNYDKDKLIKILYEYADEKYAKSIVNNIIKSRPITTTLELSEIIKSSVPESYRNKKHPARRVFQAIRIEVNDEVNVLKEALKDAFEILKPGGRIVVITFHSLEDKIVKNYFNLISKDENSLKGLPYLPDEKLSKAKIINKKVIIPSDKELNENNRSRSAKMRIIEKL